MYYNLILQVVSADQSTALLVAAANITDGRVFPDYSLCTTSTRIEQIRGHIIPDTSLDSATGNEIYQASLKNKIFRALTVLFDCRTLCCSITQSF